MIEEVVAVNRQIHKIQRYIAIITALKTQIGGRHRLAHRPVPLRRAGSPTEAASGILMLASPLSSYVTGSTVTVHGGGEKPAFLGASNADQ